jgi:hypothetical protein
MAGLVCSWLAGPAAEGAGGDGGAGAGAGGAPPDEFELLKVLPAAA